MSQEEDASGVQILEVAVHRYKSLERFRADWSPRIAVLGVNGCGKTTLFEALTLACGSRASLWQVAQRANDPDPGAVSVVLRGSPAHIPTPPALIESTPGKAADREVTRAWWKELGVEHGRTWSDAMKSSGLPTALIDLLTQQGPRPIIRYRLESLTGMTEARRCDRGAWYRAVADGHVDADDAEDPDGRPNPRQVVFERTFSRVLALPTPLPEWLCEMACDLPDLVAPLRSWNESDALTGSRFTDVLELPVVTELPVIASWLATERSSNEACFDLQESEERAKGPAGALLLALHTLPLRASDSDPFADARWWLSVKAVKSANELLDQLPFDIRLEANDDTSDSAFLCSPGNRKGERNEMLCSTSLLERLSAGERVWVDIALSWASAELEHVSMLNEARNVGLLAMSEDERLERAISLSDQVEVETEGFWNAADIDRALEALDEGLLSQWNHPLLRAVRGSHQEHAVLSLPAVRALANPPLRLLLIDEPERHLHTGAQRSVSATLEHSLGGAEIALATHSPYFLRRSGWAHRHLSPTPEGVIVDQFEPREISLKHAVVRELGWGHGELLAWDRSSSSSRGSTTSSSSRSSSASSWPKPVFECCHSRESTRRSRLQNSG